MKKLFHIWAAFLLSLALGSAPFAAEKPKAVILHVGVTTSGNWDLEGFKAFKAMGEKHGFEISTAERVSYAKAAQIMRDYASRGYKLIMAHSSGFGGAAIEVAPEFPNSWFVVVSDLKSTGGRKNVAGWAYNWNEYGYLEGVFAGLMTKTNKVGIVAAIPIPSISRQIASFIEGMKSVNPKGEVEVIWAQTWTDPAKGKEAALQLIARGADIVTHAANITGWGVFEAAKEKNVMALGNYSDESDRAPDNILTSGVLDFKKGYDELGRMVKAGSLKPTVYQANIANGDVYLAPYHKSVPEDVRKKVDEVKAKIASGELKIPVIMYKSKKK